MKRTVKRLNLKSDTLRIMSQTKLSTAAGAGSVVPRTQCAAPCTQGPTNCFPDPP